MALLKSANIPGIDLIEYRDTLYYNQYDYRLRFFIPGSRYTYWCKKPEDLDVKLAGKSRGYASIRKEDIQKVTENLTALKEIVKLTKERKEKKEFSMRLEYDTLAIFANDLSILETIKNRLGQQYVQDCTLAETAGFSGVKYFVEEPKHKYRVYLKSRRVEDNFHIELRDLLARQKSLYPSNALRRWYNNDGRRYGIWYFRWTSSAHFIDYDEESTLSYLAIMYGDMLGKKYKLEKRPDPV